MRALTTRDILDVWEQAAPLHPVDRALALLAYACPELDPEALADLPLGRRDALLAELRLRSLGDHAAAWARCPGCGADAEFPLPAQELAAAANEHHRSFETAVAGRTFVLALPTSRTLAEAATCASDEAARRCLVAACIVEERAADGRALASPTLDADVEAAIGEVLAERDPWADVRLCVRCEACDSPFEVAYDPGEALWAETAAQARRLMFEVHVLARSYGWSERDVLALGPQRRHAYLDMVGA